MGNSITSLNSDNRSRNSIKDSRDTIDTNNDINTEVINSSNHEENEENFEVNHPQFIPIPKSPKSNNFNGICSTPPAFSSSKTSLGSGNKEETFEFTPISKRLFHRNKTTEALAKANPISNPSIIRWTYGGVSVFLYGSFDDWNERLPMSRRFD
jgi:hypothetical protein